VGEPSPDRQASQAEAQPPQPSFWSAPDGHAEEERAAAHELGASRGPRELGKRAASGILLAVLAIAAATVGGLLFILLWTAAACGIYWEWTAITVAGSAGVRVAGTLALLAGALACGSGYFVPALAAFVAGGAIAGLLGPPQHRFWAAGGVLYAGSVLFGPVLLRSDSQFGLTAILFLFAVVWATDVLAYFTGRGLKGPRLAPRISPNKTWSGLGGGIIGGVAAGVAVIAWQGASSLAMTACVAAVLSIACQGGDLFESAVKRRFGVKDTSHLIPGHGGLMDRLDGFLAAASVAALVGVAHAGMGSPARGLLLW
jgi:phosphatidate cytidylyltransferase